MQATATLTKLSERTCVCPYGCGERRFYKAETPEGTEIVVAQGVSTNIAKHPDGGYLMHSTMCKDVQYKPAENPHGRETTNGQPETNGGSNGDRRHGNQDDRLDALQSLLGDLVGNTVDEDAVRKIVDERADERLHEVAKAMDAKVAELSAPTRVTVHNARTDEERELPDVAHEALPKILRYVDRGYHVWMVGPAGTGKSHIPEQVAEALDVPYYPQGKVSDPVELVGYMDANGNYVEGSLREPFENGGVFLLDEADSGHPAALDVLNQGLSNGMMRFPDRVVKVHPDFVCLAAANTFGTGPDRTYSSRRKIDSAFLNRFWSVDVGYDEALEDALVEANTSDDARETVGKYVRFVRHLRSNALEHGMSVVFGMRETEQGADALSAGDPWADVVSDRVRKGISEKDWNKLTQGWS